MAEAARAFGDHGRQRLFQSIPGSSDPKRDLPVPWQKVTPGGMPPMMLEFRLREGRCLSLAYNDLRSIKYRDAGFLQLGFLGLERLLVSIEGRNLQLLRPLLNQGMIVWIEESGHDDDGPDEQSIIDRIVIEAFEAK